MNDDDDVSCAKRCKEKRKSQYPTLNLHVLGLYMYVYLQLQLNSICAYSSSSSLFMIWLLIDYERRRRETAYRVFVFFLLLLQLWLSARIYILYILLPRVTYYYICCYISFVLVFTHLSISFRFVLFCFLECIIL